MGTDLGTPVAKKTLLFSREVSATASRVTPLARGDSITGARSGGTLWGGGPGDRRVGGDPPVADHLPPSRIQWPEYPKMMGFGQILDPPKRPIFDLFSGSDFLTKMVPRL